MKIYKKFFTGVEIALVLAILYGAGAGLKNYSDKRTVRNLTTENVKQAEQIRDLTVKVEELNNKKDELVEEKTKVETQLRTKASEGFSILYEQASDINKQNSTAFTDAHLETAKDYVQVWGYQAMAQLIKWQQDAIRNNLEETKALMRKNQELEKEYQDYKFRTSEEIIKTKTEAKKHEELAKTLQNKVSDFLNENNWLNKLIFWIVIGGIGYLVFSLGGFGLLFKSRTTALSAAQYYRRRKNAVAQAIKTFTEVNDDGNDTMFRIIKSSDNTMVEEDDENENPVEAYKKKLKTKKVDNRKP